jgi:hypothetical protein
MRDFHPGLDAVDFAITCSLVRQGMPRYFAPRFFWTASATPLRFTNPSPPLSWIEDFHARHR